jgi:excisionase family DNA binding protein
MDPVSVTIPDACKAIGVGRTTVYELIDDGKLDAIKVGGRRLIKVSSIRRLVGEAA